MRLPRPRLRRHPGRVAVALSVGALLAASYAPGAGAASAPSAADPAPGTGRYETPVVAADPANPTNPLAGRRWGVYTGTMEQSWRPYLNADAAWKKNLLAEIALRPKSKWFGSWIGERDIEGMVREYVRSSQAGDPDALVQMALFRMRPWGSEVCERLPTEAEKASYKSWIAGAARGIGDAHAAVVLQPDLLVARCAPDGGQAVAWLVAWATRTLSAQPHTSVYIDAGAHDWPPPSRGGAKAAVDYLVKSGVRAARGFAMNGTHYSDVRLEVQRAAEIDADLRRRGIEGKKAVISTSSNGKPFVFGAYDPQTERDNARVCRSATDPQMCVTLGIPPSMDPDAPAWGLPADTAAQAARVVDGYVWFGRPWLYNQADPFVWTRAYQLVRSWPLRPPA
ncbi:glycoside hydrolase family 6 protein [uncultured Nocardioides sp.]|uniref:glycoside hydrolase family 6 protein n=1 Tax=uncultured Nocardioides sp. TaxID=198441 RepID=UPI0026148A28|nr:glycoside hydrolase family 6 protein [uncultured Nocardioides sp.]